MAFDACPVTLRQESENEYLRKDEGYIAARMVEQRLPEIGDARDSAAFRRRRWTRQGMAAHAGLAAGCFPESWDIGLAFDGSEATRWRSWEPLRPGM